MNSNEHSTITAAKAIDLLHRTKLLNRISNQSIADHIGASPNGVLMRFRRGDMPLSQFVATARYLGHDPAQLLEQAERNDRTTINQ